MITKKDVFFWIIIALSVGILLMSEASDDQSISKTLSPLVIDNDGDGIIGLADCDDTNPEIGPTALEITGDGIDNNCNGKIDEMEYIPCDTDADGLDDNVCPGWNFDPFDKDADGVSEPNDCDDHDSYIGAEILWYVDADGDAFGDRDNSIWACFSEPGYVTNFNDCDDTNEDVNPGVLEVADDGIDNNCDGIKDPDP